MPATDISGDEKVSDPTKLPGRTNVDYGGFSNLMLGDSEWTARNSAEINTNQQVLKDLASCVTVTITSRTGFNVKFYTTRVATRRIRRATKRKTHLSIRPPSPLFVLGSLLVHREE